MKRYASLAKITQPGLHTVFKRTRLFQQLDKAKERQIIWVAGPPGAGKTTLISSYLEHQGMSCLWYQVDEGDADIATFFHYLGLAGKKAAPRKRTALPHLTPEYRAGLPAFTRHFFENLFGRLKSPFAVVFDNYQEVPGNSAIHEAIRNGLNQLPQEGLLILISRSDPPPPLARAYANQDMVMVSGKDLSLTAEESQGIARLWGLQKQLKDILRYLHGRAEGWVTGFVLMLERFKSDPQSLNITPAAAADSLFDYFVAEIMARTDTEYRDFLLRTAFLPSMTVQMAAELTQNKRAGHILADLNRQHHFTEKHVETEPVYQYHPLFRDFLRTRAEEHFSAQELEHIHLKSAELLEANGQIEAAIGLLKARDKWQRMEKLILTHAPILHAQGRLQTLENWLKSLPETLSASSPWLLYWLGACRLPYDLEESRKYFERAFDLFDELKDPTGLYLSWASVVDTYLYEWGNFAGLDRWIKTLEQLITRYPNFPSLEIEARVAIGMFNALVYRQPYHAEFSVWEERVRILAQSDIDTHHRVMIGNHLMLYYSWLGDLAKATLIMDVLRPATRGKNIAPLSLIIWQSMEGMLCWLTLDNNGCLKAIETGLQLAQDTGVHLWDFMLYAQGMYGAVNSGDLNKAEKFLEKMATTMQANRRLDAAHYHYQAASLALLQDDLPRAVEHAETAVDRAEASGSPFPQTLSHLGLAQALFERGETEQARAHLEKAMKINQGLRSRYIEYHKTLIEAYFNLEQNRNEQGLLRLREALELGKQHGYLTMTWWRPNVMTKLCAVALKHGIESEYVCQLIRKQNLLPESDVSQIEDWPWPLKVFTLGRFSLLIDGAPLKFSSRAQSRPLEMLKTLIAFGGREVSEHKFVEALWPDAEGDAAHRAFDTTLHRLRKLIGSDKAIILQDGRLTLDPRYCWVDIWSFERLLGKMERILRDQHCNQITETVDKVLALYQGPFLGDAADMPWALALRERLHSKFLRQLSAAGKYWERTQQWDLSIDYYRRVLEIDPLAEEFYQHLMTCYSNLGRRAEAITTYKRCKNTLTSLLEITPSSITEKLYQEILSK